MKTIAAREARNRFGSLLDAAQDTSVCVTKKGKAVGVLMSMKQYERLRSAAWERLAATMDRLGAEAAENDLTEAALAKLLKEEKQ